MSEKLTVDRQIAGLKPEPDRRYEKVVKGARGLRVIVYPNGTRTFVLRYVAPCGARRRLNLGEYRVGTFGLKDAQDAAEAARGAIAIGGDPAAQRAEAKQAAREAAREAELGETLDALAEEYFKAAKRGLHGGRKRPRRESAVDNNKKRYDHHIAPELGAKPFRDLRRSDIKVFMRKLASSGLMPSTVIGIGAILRQILSFAVHEERLDANPAIGAVTPVAAESRDRLFDSDALAVLWPALIAASWPRPKRAKKGETVPPLLPLTALALQLIFLTLVRRTEAAGARWEEFDMNARAWLIPGARMKSGREHLVPLSDAALAVLRSIKATTEHLKSPFLFPSEREPREAHMDGHGLTRSLTRLLADLKLPHGSPHDIRRSGFTTLVSERYSVESMTMSRVLSHQAIEGPRVGLVYNRHDYAAEKRRALALWADHLEGLVSQPPKQEADNVVRFKPRSAS